MTKRLQLFIAAFALLAMTARSSQKESVSDLPEVAATPDSQGTIVFTCTPYEKEFEFEVKAKSITVDWGDGSTNEYNDLDKTSVAHQYADDSERTVRIRAENLFEFICIRKRLTALDVSGCATLTHLECWENKLSTLDVSNNTALTVLRCFENQLSALDVSKNTALTVLNCAKNELSALDVSKNTALTYLICYMNRLSALDVSNNTVLTTLDCAFNELSALDVTKNTALIDLDCIKNELSALDVSNNTALRRLRCFENQLSALDVSNNTVLTTLYCSRNQLSADVLNRIFTDLPDRSGMETGKISIEDNPGTDTCDRSKAKNWKFLQ